MKNIGEVERRLWSTADTLRANSNFSSNEYFLPVMGLIFLRHAYSRYLKVKEQVEASLPTRGGKTRPLTKEDFAQKGSIFLTRPTMAHYMRTREELRARTNDLFDWIAAGSLEVRIGAEFPLEQAADAHRALEGRETTGKVLIRP